MPVSEIHVMEIFPHRLILCISLTRYDFAPCHICYTCLFHLGSLSFSSHILHICRCLFLNPMSELFPDLDNNYIWNFWFLGNFKKLDSKLRYDWMYYSSNLFLKAGILIIFISISFFFFVRWNMILLCKICI